METKYFAVIREYKRDSERERTIGKNGLKVNGEIGSKAGGQALLLP
jgi:hypothetical protein